MRFLRACRWTKLRWWRAVLLISRVKPEKIYREMDVGLLAMFAGNATLLASVANLIVVQKARHEVEIAFGEYSRVGLPVTVLTILAGGPWLSLFGGRP